MKPAAFDYERPERLDDACALLAREDVMAKPIAGGQSLGPMLNLRLAQPELLVDLLRIPELRRVEAGKDNVEVGACVTHADIEDGCIPGATGSVLARVAARIAYRGVRNRGTIGGSLAHADPAADWLSCLSALGAEALIYGPSGPRAVPMGQFLIGAFEAAMEQGEIQEAVRLPALSKDARFGFYKVCRKTGEFAQAIGAVLFDPERGVLRAVIGATNSSPTIIEDATPLFESGGPKEKPGSFDRSAARLVMEESGLDGDDYFMQIHLIALERAAKML